MERATRSKKLLISEDLLSHQTRTSKNKCPRRALTELSSKATNSQISDNIKLATRKQTLKSLEENAVGKTSTNVRESEHLSRFSNKMKRTVNVSPRDDGKSTQSMIVDSTGLHVNQQKDVNNLSLKKLIDISRLDLKVPQPANLEDPLLASFSPNLMSKEIPILFNKRQQMTGTLPNSNASKIQSSITDIADDEDSFLEKITSRSPAKPVPRTEDNIEALDELEMALEVLHEVTQTKRFIDNKIPSKTQDIVGPNKNLASIRNTNYKALPPNPSKEMVTKKMSRNMEKVYVPRVTTRNRLNNCNNTMLNKDATHPQIQSARLTAKKLSENSNLKSSKELRSTQITRSQSNQKFYHKKIDSFPRIVETEPNTKPVQSKSHLDVFTRLSTGTPRHRSFSSRVDSSTLKDKKAVMSRMSSPNLSLNTQSISQDINSRVSTVHRYSTKSSTNLKSNSPPTVHKKAPLNRQSPKHGLVPRHPMITSNQQSKISPRESLKETPNSCETRSNRDSENCKNDQINAAILIRAEAAERGRQAVIKWAEKQMTLK